MHYRLKWVAHLEFSHNKETSDLSWDSVERRLPRTDKLRAMVREGIPHSLRPQLWMRFSGKNNVCLACRINRFVSQI